MAKDRSNPYVRKLSSPRKQPPLSATLLAFAVAVSLGAAAHAGATDAVTRPASGPHVPRPINETSEASLLTRLSEAAKALMGKVERKAPINALTLRDALVDSNAAVCPAAFREARTPHLPLFQLHLLNLPPPLA